MPRHISILATVLLVAISASSASAQWRIGIAAPIAGGNALLGEQIRSGSALAAEMAGDVELLFQDDQCTAEGGAAAARSFVASQVAAVAGFLCIDALEAALPILSEADIPVLTVGVRLDALTDRRERTGFQVFRLAPRADGEARALADILTDLWRDELFALIDDGTIYGRELVESFRLAAELRGLRPVFTDTYRPQLENQIGLAGRLRRSGATHALVGGDRADVATLARDASELGYDLVLAGGEALRAPSEGVDLAPGTLMVALPEWAEIAEPATLESIRAAGTIPDGYVLPAFSSVEILAAGLRSVRSNGGTLSDALSAGAFETAIGTIRFDANGDLAENPYRLFRYDGQRFVPAR